MTVSFGFSVGSPVYGIFFAPGAASVAVDGACSGVAVDAGEEVGAGAGSHAIGVVVVVVGTAPVVVGTALVVVGAPLVVVGGTGVPHGSDGTGVC